MSLLKKLCILIIILTANSLISFGQVSLTIEITGLRNNRGQILIELCDENEVNVKGVSQKVSNNQCILLIQDLKPGKYGLKYFHDENNNNKLDVNWIGIPIEGYGFSNNAKGRFGPPAFEKTIFELKQSMSIQCYVGYIFK